MRRIKPMKLTYFFALILVLFLFPGPALALDDDFEKGREAIDKQDYDEAITRFTAVIQNEPQNASAYIHRGYAYLLKKKLDKAIEDLTESIRLDPNDGSAFYNRGLAYL